MMVPANHYSNSPDSKSHLFSLKLREEMQRVRKLRKSENAECKCAEEMKRTKIMSLGI